MGLYENNIKWLECSQKDIFEKLMEMSQLSLESESDEIQIFKAKNGEEGLSVKKEGRVYRLNSAYKPYEEAKNWGKQYKSEDIERIAFIYGLGNGMFAKELYKVLGEDGKLCIYEPSMEVFKFALKHFDLTELLSSERVRFFVKGINEKFFYNFASEFITEYNVKSRVICSHPQYPQIYKTEYEYFIDKLKDAVMHVMKNFNTRVFFGKQKTKNTLHNLNYLDQSIPLYDLVNDEWKKYPAIIVAAGPSLDKNVKELKKAKGKAVIIATDTALRCLARENIMPDFIITIDPMKPVEYFSSYPQFFKVPMFCKEAANHEITKLHTGIKIWFNCNKYFKEIYHRYGKEISKLGSGGSVATSAFMVCVELGIKRIVLIGQDLAYEGDKTHADGLEDRIKNEEATIEITEGIDGNPVKTRGDWRSYKIWFEDAIILRPEIEVIDATEGGAKIQGTKIMALKEVIDKYCKKEIDCNFIMSKIANGLDNKQLEETYNYIRRQLKEISIINEEMKKIIKNCNQCLLEITKNPYVNVENYGQKIVNSNNKIHSYSIMQLISDYACEDVHLEDIYQMTEDKVENIKKVYQMTKVAYETLLKNVDFVKEMLKENIQEIDLKEKSLIKEDTNVK